MMLLGCAAVALLYDTAPRSGTVDLLLLALAGGALIVVSLAIAGADNASRLMYERLGREAAGEWVSTLIADLQSIVAAGRDESQRFLAAIRRGERPEAPAVGGPPPADPVERLVHDIGASLRECLRAVSEIAATPLRDQPLPLRDQPLEVFVTLADRTLSQINLAITGVDTLQRRTEDPDVLDGLVDVDHRVMRIRRLCESVKVLGGAQDWTRWDSSVVLGDVLQAAIAEIEDYARVEPIPCPDYLVRGYVAADLIHILAELLDNGTKFSPAGTQVHLRTEMAGNGLVIDVVDRGIGIKDAAERSHINGMLRDPARIDATTFLQSGLFGLPVVAHLAHRQGITVELQPNVYGGVQASVMVPFELLDSVAQDDDDPQRQPALVTAAAGGTMSPPSGGADLEPRHAVDVLDTPPSPAPTGPVEEGPATRPPDRASETTTGGRPTLPRRQPRAHLPNGLREQSSPETESSPEPDLQLWAAYRKGADGSNGRARQENDDDQ
jgi:signal transduction histidine kinase